MKSFDRAARTYDAFGSIQREMALWLSEWLPSDRDGTAIEVGAGTGIFTEQLRSWRGEMTATDASADMIGLGAAQYPRFPWKIALAGNLPGVSYKWIFSSSFLQWADDPSPVLEHWRNLLDEGGRILAGLFVFPTLPELEEILPGAAPLRWRTAEDWEKIIQKSGLSLLRSGSAQRAFIFPSALDLLRTLHRTGTAPKRRVSPGRLRTALQDYDDRFASNNGVRSTWTFFRFEAANSAEITLHNRFSRG